tara:strand:- start:3042 stop:3527 length:486 start_codon:yes stop_codon:yes gene_type:complete
MIPKKAVLSGFYTGLKKHNWKGRLVLGCPAEDGSDYCDNYRVKHTAFAKAWVEENKGLPFWNIMGALKDTESGEFYSWFNSLYQHWADDATSGEAMDHSYKISGSDVHDKLLEVFPDKEEQLTEWREGASLFSRVTNDVTEKSKWAMLCMTLANAFNMASV